MKLKVKCDFCGEPIKDVKKHLGRNKHFFCSRDCYKQFKTKKQANDFIDFVFDNFKFTYLKKLQQ